MVCHHTYGVECDHCRGMRLQPIDPSRAERLPPWLLSQPQTPELLEIRDLLTEIRDILKTRGPAS